MADNWQLKAVLSANAAGLLKTLDSVNKATRSTRKHLADIGSGSVKLAGSLALPVGMLGSLAAGFSIAGIVTAVKNFAALGDEVAKGSQRIGVSIADYQQLNYVAGQSGVSAEELGSSMGRLNKGIAEAAAGKNKDLASLFAKSGIAMRGANGELRSGADLMPEVADLFARNGNAAVQARMGNAIYGKSWQALAPLLQGGSEGIKQLQERYKRLGIEVDSGAIKAGEAFGDQMDDLSLVTRSYGNTITAKLLPALSPLLEKTIQWAVANRAVITTKITAFVTQFSEAMAKVDWNAVVAGVGSLFSGLKSLVQWLGGARNALIALVVFMNASSLLAFASLTVSVAKFGASLVVLSAGALPSALTGLRAFTVAMAISNGGALALIGTLGLVLGKLALVGAAGYAAGLGIGWLIDKSIQLGTGDKTATLGTALYGAFNDDPIAQMDAADKKKAALTRNANLVKSSGIFNVNPMPPLNAASKPNLLASASRVKASGAINVNFQNAPPGMRVVENFGGTDVPVNTNVGYRSFATGMPG